MDTEMKSLGTSGKMPVGHGPLAGNEAESAGGAPPPLGLIMLDTVFPRIPGDVGNPDTFSFPVIREVVEGASPERVVNEADPTLLQPFVEAAQRLEARNAHAIATSCGFLAIFHGELAGAVKIPVFSSSLLQVHTARSVMPPGKKVGVITASRRALTRRHFAGVGISEPPAAVAGMEDAEEFSSVFLGGKRTIDIEKCRKEMVETALKLVTDYPDVGSLVLECTNMPPYARAVQKAVGLPVFDVVTLINHARSVVVQRGYADYTG